MLFEEKILERFLKKLPDNTGYDWEKEKEEESALAIFEEVFPAAKELIRGKTVLDFGCGEGHLALALGRLGAKRVIGVEIQEKHLCRARELANEVGLNSKVEFTSFLDEGRYGSFDIAVLQNSFEHVDGPGELLRKIFQLVGSDGKVFLTFGPPWLSPYGSHMNQIFSIPWVNILFSESAIMRVRARVKGDGARHFSEVDGGLNMMTVSRFEKIVRAINARIEYLKYDCVWKMSIFGNVPFLRELFINRVSCILSK